MTNKQKSEAFKAIFAGVKVSVRNVRVLGAYVHIDTFAKHEAQILDAMTKAGMKPVMVSNGRHMDGIDGFRMVFSA